MRERRSKDQIVVEILHLCEDGENITRIVYRTNTSFAIVKAYLHILMKNNLLEFIEASPALQDNEKGPGDARPAGGPP